MAVTLTQRTVRASTKKSARQHAQTLHKWSARTTSIQKMALCATSSFVLGEVRVLWCYDHARVFHELNASSVDLLHCVFVLSLHLLCSVPISASLIGLLLTSQEFTSGPADLLGNDQLSVLMQPIGRTIPIVNTICAKINTVTNRK